MSDQSASPEADSGRRDSARSLHGMQDPLVRSLDQFAAEEVDPLIHHHAWGAQDDAPGFHERFVVPTYAFAPAPESIPESDLSSNGDGASLAVTAHSHTTLSTMLTRDTPSLDSRSTVPSKSSVRSWGADSAVAGGVLDEEGNLIGGVGLAVQPPNGARCLFSFLGCSKVFLDPIACHDHSKSHFQGATPPKTMRCLHSDCDWLIARQHGEETWQATWSHLVCEHNLPGRLINPWKRPDILMIQYLYNIRVIDGAQYQELREYGQLGLDTGAYHTTEGREKHERRMRRPHMAARR